jgi:hypothetical protein
LPASRAVHKLVRLPVDTVHVQVQLACELFCQLIATNMQGEIYPLWEVSLRRRMLSIYAFKAKEIETVCGIN